MRIETRMVGMMFLGVAISASISYAIATQMKPAPVEDIDGKMALEQIGKLQAAVGSGYVDAKIEGRAAKIVTALDAAGILNLDETVQTHWWCWVARCERTERDCKASIAMFGRQALEEGKPDMARNVIDNAKCEQLRIAFCADTQCYGTFEFCTKGADKPKLCRGVE
jgi:hypothetical protein